MRVGFLPKAQPGNVINTERPIADRQNNRRRLGECRGTIVASVV